ncbi:MAG: hypothetical protein AAGG72_10625, partial [Pseudomonadota bacterium]
MAENGYEWGPWIEHDGMGCPCPGELVESVTYSGLKMQHIALSVWLDRNDKVIVRYNGIGGNAWLLTSVQRNHQIIRYRIRRRNL